MDDEKLIRMANQIARSFQALGETRAVQSTANHIALFWSRPMREGLETAARRQEEAGPLSPIALAAARSLSSAEPAQ